jgi:hypothetical protein
VIVALLKASTAITAIVPATRIMAGDAPIDTLKPLIVVTQISSVPEGGQIRRNEPNRVHLDRVQVSYLFDAPRAGEPSAGEGPDLSDAATELYSRSRDFIVRWTGD